MNVIVTDDTALVEEECGVRKWKREKLDAKKLGFYVEVYVEGYNPDKSIWMHDSRRFDTFLEALEYDRQISSMSAEDFDKWLGRHSNGDTFEDTRILEVTSDGTYEWDRVWE